MRGGRLARQARQDKHKRGPGAGANRENEDLLQGEVGTDYCRRSTK